MGERDCISLLQSLGACGLALLHFLCVIHVTHNIPAFIFVSRVAEDNYKDPWWGDSLKFAEAFRKATGTNATYIEASS